VKSAAQRLRSRWQVLRALGLGAYVIFLACGLARTLLARSGSPVSYYVAARSLKSGHRLDQADITVNPKIPPWQRAFPPALSSYTAHYLTVRRKEGEPITETMTSSAPLLVIPCGHLLYADNIPADLQASGLIDVGTRIRFCDKADCGDEFYSVSAVVCASGSAACAAVYSVESLNAPILQDRIKAGARMAVEPITPSNRAKTGSL
jgi:hypothetical protein